MDKCTVILLRPDYIANSTDGAGYGIDTRGDIKYWCDVAIAKLEDLK